MKKQLIVVVSIVLFLFSYCYGRITLINMKLINISEYDIILSFALDVLFALSILIGGFFLSRKSKIIAYIFILTICVFHIANMEYIYALNNVINMSDVHYLGNIDFIKGSFSTLNFPIYLLALLSSSILFLIYSDNLFKNKIICIPKMEILVFLLLFGLIIQFIPTGSEWSKNNFEFLTFVNSIKKGAGASTELNLDSQFYQDTYSDFYASNRVDEGKEILLSNNYNKKRNILLVVLEGIPGGYLQESQNANNYSYKTKLESFDKIYKNSVVIPNFITHNNQTIRGLYSVLSGRYPKLDGSTPKATEYSQLLNREKMLPSLLKENSYNTAFLQAAPLEFMAKDQFAKDAGFERVLGTSDFSYQYVPFGWGIDDRAFLEQSVNYLESLSKENSPWFATMLTVGTHHPYAIPEELEKEIPDRKEASVKYLDESLALFLESLEETGITDDTLVLFTSDESHGLNNHPLGSNWGFLLAYDPEIQGPIINNSIYGQIDILPSIMDYLDLEEGLYGKSIFRNYTNNRPMFFSSHYNGDIFLLENEKTLYQVDANGNLYQIIYRNLFEVPYKIVENNNEKLKDKILDLSYALNSELSNSVPQDSLLISKTKNISLSNNKSIKITSGQYITLPKESIVTISFDYDTDKIETLNSLKFDLNLDSESDRFANIISERNSLKSGHVVHQFFNDKKYEKFSFDLSLTPYLKNSEKREIEISNLRISFESYGSNKDLNSDYNKIEMIKNEETVNNLLPYMSFNQPAYFTSTNSIHVDSYNDMSILIYGPYISLEKGKYGVEYTLGDSHGNSTNNSTLYLDVVSNKGEKLISYKEFSYSEYMKKGRNKLVIPFQIENELESNIEFRLKGENIHNLEIVGVKLINESNNENLNVSTIP